MDYSTVYVGMDVHKDSFTLCAYTIEAENADVDYLAKVLDQYEIDYKIIRPIDPREKYRYYEKCGYPYTPMRRYI